MSNRFALTHHNFSVLLGASILVLAVLGSATPAALTPGTGFYDWHDATGESDASKDIRVFYYRPTTITQ